MKKTILILLLIIIFAVSVTYVLDYNERINDCVFLTEYTYTDKALPEGFEDCKFLFISDLHNAPFSNEIIDYLKNYMPDFVVVTGDMIQLPESNFSEITKIAEAALELNIPIYAVSGNHERQNDNYDEIINTLWAKKVYMLENGSVPFEKNGDKIQLVGIKDPKHDEITDQKIRVICDNIKYERSKEPELFSILLSHRAGLYPDIKDTGVNLILSGDMHGGIIRLPLIGGLIGGKGKEILPKYEYGVVKEGDGATMIVSGGCDSNPNKVRYFNPPEVLLITLKGE